MVTRYLSHILVGVFIAGGVLGAFITHAVMVAH